MSSLNHPLGMRRSAAPPLRRLLAADSFFDDLWPTFGIAPPTAATFTPRMDVKETDSEYIVSVELPGLEEKDVEISLEENVLTIRGEKRSEHTDEHAGYKHVETVAGRFERRLALPVELNADAVTAKSKLGVVTITLPKPEVLKPEVRTIPVTTA